MKKVAKRCLPVLWLGLFLACTAPPERPGDRFPARFPARFKDSPHGARSTLEDSNAQVARAATLFKAGRYEQCLAICELLLEERRAVRKTETLRFLAAEAHYQQGEFELALFGYRRLLDDFPFTRAHGVIPDRLFVIGSALAEQPRPILGGVMHNRKPGIEALGFLVVNYPEHRQADQAWLILADQHEQEASYALAVEAYRRLLARRPGIGIREQALHRLAACLFRQTRGAAYDAQPMITAFHVAKQYLAEFKDGAYQSQVRELVVQIEGAVRRSELLIADFYRHQDNQQGARLHEERSRTLEALRQPLPLDAAMLLTPAMRP